MLRQTRQASNHHKPLSQPNPYDWVASVARHGDRWVVPQSASCWTVGLHYAFLSLMWTASDLAVAGLVVTVNVASRCPFNTTGLYTVTQNQAHSGVGTVYVSPFGPAYRMINQARITSTNNGGLAGICKKVNSDIKFRADSLDVWGRWNCQDTLEDTSYQGGISNFTPVLTDMKSKGLIFDEYSLFRDIVNPNNTIGNVVVWSSSEQAVGFQSGH